MSFVDAKWPDRPLDYGFKNARFMERVDLSAKKFSSISMLSDAIFEITPILPEPSGSDTHDSVFRHVTRITSDAVKMDLKEQKGKQKADRFRKGTKKDAKDSLLQSVDSRWAALSGGYRVLKQMAQRKGDFLLEQTYYRFEIKSRVKRPAIPFWEKVAASFYGLTSDYGNSIARPFVALGFMLFGFALLYVALACLVGLVPWKDTQSLQTGFYQSLDFSLKNVFRPLSALSTDPPREGDAARLAGKLLNNYGDAFGLIVTSISIVQSLIGIVLAFLFGLAVRRRFQIE